MKVLVVVANISGGGAEHVARKNIECLLNDTRYEVAVLTTDRLWKPKNNIKIYYLENFTNSKNVFDKMARTIYLKNNYECTMRCLKTFEPDIIHIHNFIPYSPSFFHALKMYKKKNATKVVMTHHTYSYVCTNDALYNYRKKTVCNKCIGKLDRTILRENCADSICISFAKYIQKKGFKKYWEGVVDLHISPSEFLKSKLVEANLDGKVEVIYNPCIALKEDVNLQNRENTIVYFGRVNKEKNIVEFAKAFEKSETDLKLLIIGVGNTTSELKELLKKSRGNNIRFIEQFLDTRELNEYLKRAKYFVLPSVWYENSPVSIVEAVNNSLIPIVSDLGGMKELVELFGVGYLLEQNDEMKNINLIETILNNYDKDIQKIRESRDKLDYFMVERYKDQISRIYNELLTIDQ